MYMLDWLLHNTPIFYLTQSLWRDEAFSILIAEKPIASFIATLNFEPPLYYILLHIWIKLFGNSEIATRSLSLLGFSLATCVVILWAEKRFRSHYLSWMVPVLFFLNPMLLYYAFEVRAYGVLMFFSTLSIYAYGQKRYKLAAFANILAFYTHTYAIFIPIVQCIHFLISHPNKKRFMQFSRVVSHSYIRSLFLTGISIAPWVIPLYEEAKNMRPTWYYPVDVQLIRSVLGNMFIGYDGTPGGLWGSTAVLSFILVMFFMLAYQNKEHKSEKIYFLFTIVIPLVIVIGISFFKPLFVNRYLIYVTIAQVLLLGYTIHSLKNPLIQKSVALGMLLFIVGANVYLPQKKAKLDIRSIVKEANAIKGSQDVLYTTSPLIFFETVYYTPEREKVFLYNPHQSPFPWYVGEAAFSQSQMAYELPHYPKRAVMIAPDKSITISYQVNTPLAIQ
jgi:hypothetical protein